LAMAIAVPAASCFGAADQYFGSLTVAHTLGFWTVSVSLLSAPWLVLPFLLGCTQTSARRAAIIGFLGTMAALAGYFLMIMGPFEGGTWTTNTREIFGLLRSNPENILGGMVTGPLFGWLGRQWRVRRAWYSPIVVAAVVCLEPAAHILAGEEYPDARPVYAVEIATGLATAVVFLVAGGILRQKRTGDPLPTGSL
jgi:hypothetical protein